MEANNAISPIIPAKFETVLVVMNDQPGWFVRYGLLVILAGLGLFALAFYPVFRKSAGYAVMAAVRPSREVSGRDPIGRQAAVYEGVFSVPVVEARRLQLNGLLRIDTREFTGDEHYSEGRITNIGGVMDSVGRVDVAFRFMMPNDQRFRFDKAEFAVFIP